MTKSMTACFLCANLFSSAFAVEAATSFDELIVPIHEEPNHRHVLHSNSLRVFDAYFLSQQVSLYHTHEKDSVMICLEGGEVTNELPGQDVVPRPPIPTGKIYYRLYATSPFVHRIRNLSTTPFRILDIEILKEQGAAIELNPLSPPFQVALENDRVRVSKLYLAPRQSTGEILFTTPRLLVMTEKGRIVIASVASSETIDVDQGYLHMQETSGAETISNQGDDEIEIVVVEMKA